MEEQNVIPLTHCFLDTNVFLHFQHFDTVDWPKVLGVQQVCLMLTTTVMEELNYHKDDSKNPGRQKRAREILSRLDDILPADTAGIPVSLGQNVKLQEILEEPDVKWKALKLNPQKGDDYLLASILVFRDADPAATICFVTKDFPARRKALRWNIPVGQQSCFMKKNGKCLQSLPTSGQLVPPSTTGYMQRSCHENLRDGCT